MVVTTLVKVLMMEIAPALSPTYTLDPSGDTASDNGDPPTERVRLTALVAVLMTLTVLSLMLVTYTSAPFGVITAR
jgi:hypothetical protein